MKSSTSHRAGSSRIFLKTMYFTSGVKAITSWLRARTSPDSRYRVQSSSASWLETRFLDGLERTADIGLAPPELALTDGQNQHRPAEKPRASPFLGIR